MRTSRRINVLNAYGTPEMQAAVEEALSRNRRFVVSSRSAGSQPKDETDSIFDVIVVAVPEFDDDTPTLFNTLKAEGNGTPIIAVFGEGRLSEEQLRQLFKLGIHDWQHVPLDRPSFEQTVISAVRESTQSTNRVHAVISAVGGAGGTTVAISLCDLMASARRRTGGSVALFDLDFSTGNCSFVLNMPNPFGLDSVISHPNRIDAEFVRQIQKYNNKGFFLYSFKKPELNLDLNGYELVLRFLDAVSSEHDETVLDIPYYETDWKMDVLAGVNSYTVVTSLNVPAIKHAVDLIDRIKAARGNDADIQVVFNKHRARLFGRRLRKAEIKQLLGDIPFSYLPEEESVILESVDRGILPSETGGSSRFLKELRRYIKSHKMLKGGVQ